MTLAEVKMQDINLDIKGRNRLIGHMPALNFRHDSRSLRRKKVQGLPSLVAAVNSLHVLYASFHCTPSVSKYKAFFVGVRLRGGETY